MKRKIKAKRAKKTKRAKKASPSSPPKRAAGARASHTKTSLREDKLQSTPWDRSDDQIERDLLTGDNIADLQKIFGAGGYRELRDLAKEAQSRSVRGGMRVLILPGIMGSKLGIQHTLLNDVLWFNPVEIAAGRLPQLRLTPTGSKYTAVGVILFAYLRLKLKLKIAGFDADFHAFDWRNSVSDSGKELADRIKSEGRPVELVAHSMGGLVARAALTRDLKNVGKVIMLGTPNYGSFAPVQVLRGTYDTVAGIAKLDLLHSAVELVNRCFNTFPGLYEMLPSPEKFTGTDLFSTSAWPGTDPHPLTDLLNAAKNVQSRMITGDSRFYLIAGFNRETVVGVREDVKGEFTYDVSQEGDGTVPLTFAKLKGIPESQIYYVEETHGNLPNNSDVERAVKDLLGTGKTGILPVTLPPVQRGLRSVRESELSQKTARTAVAVTVDPRQALLPVAAPLQPSRFAAPLVTATAVSAAVSATNAPASSITFQNLVVGRRRQRRLDLQVCSGSITQVDSRAWVLGLFQNVRPSGAAAAIDRRLGGAISDFAARRMFSGDSGEIFSMPLGRNALRGDMVLFAGMGPFDAFNPETLEMVSENVVRVLVRTRVHEFATVAMGAGSGFSIARLLEASLTGYFRALKDADASGIFRSITICETDATRLAEIKQELYRLSSTSLFDDIEVSLDEVTAEVVPDDTVAEVRAVRAPEPVYLLVRSETSAKAIGYRMSVLSASGRASLVSDIVSVANSALESKLAEIDSVNSLKQLSEFGKTLTETVLPKIVRAELMEEPERHLVVVHDAEASKIPWETLRFTQPNSPEWAPGEKAGISHRLDADKLPLATWSERRRKSNKISILLIVDPNSNLPGAVEEGNRVTDLASRDNRIVLTKLMHSQATRAALLSGMRSGQYDVVHYAGHAGFDAADPERLGLLCFDGILHGSDLASMTQLPSLVFFNACEAARVRGFDPDDRPPAKRAETIRQSFSVAEALLRGGVANFLGTYWSVGDEAAKEFSSHFYDAVLDGDCLGDAIQKGRTAVRAINSRDWADYVFYGSYDFALKLI